MRSPGGGSGRIQSKQKEVVSMIICLQPKYQVCLFNFDLTMASHRVVKTTPNSYTHLFNFNWFN